MQDYVFSAPCAEPVGGGGRSEGGKQYFENDDFMYYRGLHWLPRNWEAVLTELGGTRIVVLQPEVGESCRSKENSFFSCFAQC